MKRKISLLAALSAVSATTLAQAAATIDISAAGNVAVCANAANKPILGGTGATVSGAPITTATTFVKTAFAITCGASTHAYLNNGYVSGTGFAVGSGSVKGNQTFRGGASSGAIVLSAGCASTGCTTADVSTAIALAVTNGS